MVGRRSKIVSAAVDAHRIGLDKPKYFCFMASWLGSLTHDGEACNASVYANLSSANVTSAHGHDHPEDHPMQHTFGWGVALSMVADAFIAIALCTQKYAHNSNKGPNGKPVVHFLKLRTWWLGILMNIFGEAGNAYAYSLAPASVVAPVGSVSVVVNEIICVLFLNEKLRRRDIVGLTAVIGGVVLVICGVPEVAEELSVHHILSDAILFNPPCYWWLISLMLFILLFTTYVEKRYAQEYILVWLLLCSSISSITVACCRSFFSLVNEIPTDCSTESCVHGVIHPPCTQTVGHYLFWVLLLMIIVTAVWSAMYLNKAMMVYGNTEVVVSVQARGECMHSSSAVRAECMRAEWRRLHRIQAKRLLLCAAAALCCCCCCCCCCRDIPSATFLPKPSLLTPLRRPPTSPRLVSCSPFTTAPSPSSPSSAAH